VSFGGEGSFFGSLMMTESEVKRRVAIEVVWWIGERRKKFEELKHESMSVNPFLMPLIFGIHTFSNFEELSDFLVAAHLATGYSTGFGKLMDEKILPRVFETKKLDKSTRKIAPLNLSVFDDIDHIVPSRNGNPPKLLSLKAGRWTIQLAQAVQLNRSFQKLLQLRSEKKLGDLKFDEIAVGVFYGTKDTLTAKYDIFRGVNSGANHDVADVTADVKVYAGKEFWTWLNEGQDQTQFWVLEGIHEGFATAEKSFGKMKDLISDFKKEFANQYGSFIRKDATIDWGRIMQKING